MSEGTRGQGSGAHSLAAFIKLVKETVGGGTLGINETPFHQIAVVKNTTGTGSNTTGIDTS